jgi:hypothetical protein
MNVICFPLLPLNQSWDCCALKGKFSEHMIRTRLNQTGDFERNRTFPSTLQQFKLKSFLPLLAFPVLSSDMSLRQIPHVAGYWPRCELIDSEPLLKAAEQSQLSLNFSFLSIITPSIINSFPNSYPSIFFLPSLLPIFFILPQSKIWLHFLKWIFHHTSATECISRNLMVL